MGRQTLIEVNNLKKYFPVGGLFSGGRKLVKAVDDSEIWRLACAGVPGRRSQMIFQKAYQIGCAYPGALNGHARRFMTDDNVGVFIYNKCLDIRLHSLCSFLDFYTVSD